MTSFGPFNSQLNKNVGCGHLTNLYIAGRLADHDQTAYIQNWYARSNFVDVMSSDALKAWNAFTHVTTVSMVMGLREARAVMGRPVRTSARMVV